MHSFKGNFMKSKDSNTELVRFGQQVRKIREKLGISQEELAFRSGLHRTYIGSAEIGERNVSLLNIIRILKGLQTEISIFFKDWES